MLRIASRIADVPAADWDACARGHPTGRRRLINPFISHAFLLALEDSGSATRETGWLPQHLLLEDGTGALIALHALLSEIALAKANMSSTTAGPTPMSAPAAAIIRSCKPRFRSRRSPAGACSSATATTRASARRCCCRPRCKSPTGSASPRCTSPSSREDEWQLAGELGFLQRTDQQFHWLNEGYRSFDDFLAALASRKRKAIRKERREALDRRHRHRMAHRAAISPRRIWDAFFAFYMDTGSRKWGSPYLKRHSSACSARAWPTRSCSCSPSARGRYIAGALNFIGADTLYGRYWGGIEDHPFLHFEICYYQAIDFAIAHGLARVEAGAQGEHKLARGYLPSDDLQRALHRRSRRCAAPSPTI